MEATVTVGGLLSVVGVIGGVIVVLGVLLAILSVIANGYNH